MSFHTLLPWFAPRLSPGISRVLTSIGHKTVLMRGDQIGTSTFFKRVVFVQSGLLAQGVINPGASSPFMLTLSAANSFGVPTRAIDALDNLPRRYWAVCRCEVLTVAPEIFLRVIEIDPNWNEELNRYALRRAFCERLGLMVCQAATPCERFGVFLTVLLKACGTTNIGEFPAKSFVRLPCAPLRRFVATLLNCQLEQIDTIFLDWICDGVVKIVDHKMAVRADLLQKNEAWLQPFLRMQPDIEQMKPAHRAFDITI